MNKLLGVRPQCYILLFLAMGVPAHAELARRADLGAAIVPPEGSQPARIVRFRPASVLEAAGFKVGDQVVAIDGRGFEQPESFGAAIRRLKGGQAIRIRAQRGGEAIEREVRLPAMRTESIAGLEVRYGEATSARGYRVRIQTSRPTDAKGRLPLVVFIPWLSCSVVENPFDLTDGWNLMLRDVMKGSGAQVVRIEKPGVGDSEGPDCSESDLDHDMDAFRAGIKAALADPGADPSRLVLFGGSIGGALVAILAQEFAPRAIVSAGGFSRTWYEHMLDIERRRLVLSGSAPAEVNAAMKAFTGFYDRVLLGGATPARAIAEHPEWARHWTDGPAHQYGRPIRYYQQVQALDVEGAWAKTTAPVLVVWGAYDWIMGRDEAERVAAIAGARATVVVRPRMDHHFMAYPDAGAAFREEGGAYDTGAAEAIVEFLRRL